jgi:IS30 family transposase
MQLHGRFTAATGTPVYICDPHPRAKREQRTTNGLLRLYFPKGTNLSVGTQTTLDTVAIELDDQPRQAHHTPPAAVPQPPQKPALPGGSLPGPVYRGCSAEGRKRR